MASPLESACRSIFKADGASSDLSSGGALPDDVARRFLLQPLQNSTVFGEAQVVTMNGTTTKLPKMIPPSRALRPGIEAAALPVADRSKATFSQTTLTAVTLKSEARMPFELLEDNVVGPMLRDIALGYMARVATLDMEDVLLNGDTTSADTTLAKMDGLIKRATSVTLDNLGALPSKSMFGKIERAIGKAFRGRTGFRHYLPTDAVSQWKEVIADRMTAEGDRVFVAAAGSSVTGGGYAVRAVDKLPDDAGVGSNEGTALSTSPENIVIGFFKRVESRFYEDVPAAVVGAVTRVRWACNLEWVEGVCKTTAIQSGD